MNASADGYLFNIVNLPGLSNYSWDIFKLTGGSGVSIASGTGVAPALVNGDIVECRAVGTLISGYVNGVLKGSVVDATYATGGYGIHMFTGTGPTGFWDNFEGGDFVNNPPPPMMPKAIWGRNKLLLARPHVDLNSVPLNNYVLAAVTGVYTYAGSAASTLATRLLAAATGVYSLSGIAALVAFGHKLLANTGVYTLTGSAASVLATRLLAATKGTFTLTGNAAATLWKHLLAAGTGVFTLTGIAANLARTYVLAATRGVFSLVGQAASVVYSGGVATAISEWVRRRRGRN